MKSAVIYARVSSIGDRQNNDRQIFDLRDYANRSGYQIIKTFDEHVSGAKKNEERPVLQECLEFCESDNVDCILVSELSRLGRNVDEVLATVKRCKDNNINIHFQKEGLSLFQPDGSKNPFLNIFISLGNMCRNGARKYLFPPVIR